MRGTLVALATSLVVWVVAPRAADAQLILKNDSFNGSGQVGIQQGFVAGEIGASRFVAPSAGRTLQMVTVYFGGSTAQQTVTLRVYDDSGPGPAPGAELFSADFQLTGSDSALSSMDLNGMNVVVPQQFRVGIEFQHAGVPSIARDTDNTIAADKNYMYANLGLGSNWYRSQTAGLTGDWIIRATVSDNGGGGIDAGVIDAPSGGPDASNPGPDGGGGGGTCAGNGDCAVGSYCDPDLHTCTFDCRNDSDCGSSDQCNSLGQCVAADGEAGGCCSTGTGGGVAGSLSLGTAVALLLARRRRNRAA